LGYNSGMRTLGGLALTLVLATGVSAQSRGGAPTTTGSFGSVVFPGGTPATSPNVTRSFGSVLNPGGGGPHLTVPGGVQPWFSRPSGNGHHNTGSGAVYAYPVYVFGGYGGYGGYFDPNASEQGAPQQQQQPNITVIMPPAQPATPVIINVGPGGGQYTTGGPQGGVYVPQQEPLPAVEEPPAIPDQQERYLIAFKDHTIYSASAYWVDGDTLHYFTSGNTHNQASLSLLDRALTVRLNKEFGVEFKVPAEK